MKKATKLLLSILPISSIGFLSVVSCSTNKKPDNQNKPNNNNPNPNNSSSGNQTNPNDSTAPNKNNTPSQPENQPNNGENTPNTDPKKPEEPKQPDTPKNPETPKQPEEPKKPEDKPQADQPQGDEPHRHKDEFSDLNKLGKEISFKNFAFYTSKDAITALSHLRTDGTTIKSIFSNINKEIADKYEINLELDGSEKPDNKKGLIDKVKVKFINKKDKKSKVVEFTFTGFKTNEKTPDKEDKNNKKNYIKKKEKLDSKLTGLYSSLVAYMMMYTQNPQNYKDLIQKENAINFEELENNNPNLFADREINLNVTALKSLLFDYDRELGKLYKDKIIAVSYDDVNGKLGIKLLIENTEENHLANQHSETLEFSFDGFRRIDFKKPNANVLSLLLPQNNFKDIIKKGILKKKIDDFKSEKHNEKILLTEDYVKQLIFKKLLVQISDNQHNIYNSKQTLSLQSNSKKDSYTSILGLAGGGSLYPFHTILNKDSISNISLQVNKEEKKYKVTINFEVNIPIFSSTFSDLTSHVTSGDTNTLKLEVTANTIVD
ncbi:prolipoprotein [Mycoplasma feriruminatoris]|uniref:LppA family lipoprotein n=1 Tax=Mycoplasma feriruminatoris TaxID=1179777 RepID=UPI00241F69B8|nr:LppA family lipoprotein [Mycoplasma feriruminatoris]WFQ90611.1 prolipoprotein [Mycoplasma feriruminatoris]